jgi:hypothetical protein
MSREKGRGAVFIAGSPRSGTTLMTALLDDHPQLSVFPEECLYPRPVRDLEDSNDDILPVLLKEKILRRLQGKESYLDELHDERKDYSGFDYRGFENAVNAVFRSERGEESSGMSLEGRALVALMDAYESTEGRKAVTGWIIKHPGYEHYWREIFSDFPHARMLYMIRDPREVILSRAIKRHKKRHLKRRGNLAAWKATKASRRPAIRYLDEWERSLMAASDIAQAFPDRILTVRYEDLVSNPQETMKSVAAFLGIPFDEVLLRPSFLGTPWEGNSMQQRRFTGVAGSRGDGRRISLDSDHLWQIEAWLGATMTDDPGRYTSAYLSRKVNRKALLMRLRGEGVWGYLKNRRRMIRNAGAIP